MTDSKAPANDSTPASETPYGAGARWRLPALLVFVLVVVVPLANYLMNRREIRRVTPANDEAPAAAAGQEPVAAGPAVSLIVDFDEGPQRSWSGIAWREGMTVADVLTAAVNRPEDPIEFAQQGSGDRAFLTRIGDRANEGEGGRNWTYAVNDKRADRSFAVYTLQPGDKVLWRFGPQR